MMIRAISVIIGKSVYECSFHSFVGVCVKEFNLIIFAGSSINIEYCIFVSVFTCECLSVCLLKCSYCNNDIINSHIIASTTIITTYIIY